MALPTWRRSALSRLFRLLDSDRNGYIEAEELAASARTLNKSIEAPTTKFTEQQLRRCKQR